MTPGSYQIELCETAPDRAPMDALLLDYYELMVARLEAVGFQVQGEHMRALEEFWDEIDSFLPPDGRLFLARDADGALVGCGMLKQIGDGKAELKRLYVKPEARGTGLGRALVERRIDAARDMGLRQLLVDTGSFNVEMRGLYAKLGFAETDLYPECSTYRMAPELLPHLRFFRMDL